MYYLLPTTYYLPTLGTTRAPTTAYLPERPPCGRA
jgi:hypothetical protein